MAEQEALAVHAAWRRDAELPAEDDTAPGERFASLFDEHPLAWGDIRELTERKLWMS